MSRTVPRIAVVHEWLIDYAGSERVLREILAALPQADLYALVDLPDQELRAAIPRRAVRTSFIQSLPRPRRWLRYYLPLMPYAVERLDLSAYDLIVSSNHAVAKGVIKSPRQMHLSYVHSPMRYAWDLEQEYLRAAGLDRGPMAWAARRLLRRLRAWDARSATRVDFFLANSQHVAERIRKAYGRDAQILYPPVDVSAFPMEERKEDFYVTVSRLEGYKRIDLLVGAFEQMPGRQLVVIGDGPQMRHLRAIAPANVEFKGRLSGDLVREHMQRARAFLFAGIEDFGIVIAEAQACGTPVVAFAAGGAAEIVRDMRSSQPTGVLFSEQTPQAVINAVQHFEHTAAAYQPKACRENAMRFDRAEFRRQFARALWSRWERFCQASLRPAAQST